jgi:predicted permease
MLADIRYAVRILIQNPAFAAVAVLSLALGIGANTAIFTLIDTVILRPLPVRAPQELVVVARNPEQPSTEFNYPDYCYIRDHNQSFSGVLATANWNWALSVPGEGEASEIVSGATVTGNYFEVLGVRSAVGRLFTPADNQTEGAHPVAVLGYDIWQRRFGGDFSIVGRAIRINGSTFTIIGVAERGFRGTAVGNPAQIFVPAVMLRDVYRGVRDWNTRHFWWLDVIARLKPGVSMQAASAEMEVTWCHIVTSDPDYKPRPAYNKDGEKYDHALVIPGAGGNSGFRDRFTKPLTVLMTVVGLVLLIACANVANLLLVRATRRQKEIAVRLAIGAGRGRLARQLLMETLVVSALGGVAGMVFAWWGDRALLGLLPKTAIPIDLHLQPDWRMLAFAFAASLITGVVCGLAPAVQCTRPNLLTSLKNETAAARRSRFDLRRALVVAQVAISLLLLIGAGLFVRSLSKLENLDPGFARERVLLVKVDPQSSGYKGQRLRDYYERLLARTSEFPEVRAASLAMITPLAGQRINNNVAVPGYQFRPDEKSSVDLNPVSPHYFETMGIPIVAGRDFREQDNPAFTPDPSSDKLEPPGPGPRVAIVNESFARRFFPRGSAVGGRLSRTRTFKMEESYEIVGVVKDARYFNVRRPTESMVYLPAWSFGSSIRTLCLRTRMNPEQIAGAVRREAAALDPAIPVQQTITLADQYDNSIAQERMVTTLCGFFGALALALAALGLYGVMAHSVANRVREIGIRMALGARGGEVLWLVLRETALMVGIGAAIGIPAALLLTRLVASLLYGLTPQDPLSLAVSTLILVAITVLAGYIPARRAIRVDPMVALRYE